MELNWSYSYVKTDSVQHVSYRQVRLHDISNSNTAVTPPKCFQAKFHNWQQLCITKSTCILNCKSHSMSKQVI